jgi:hypothetical protein
VVERPWYWQTTSSTVDDLDWRSARVHPCRLALSALGKRHTAHWPGAPSSQNFGWCCCKSIPVCFFHTQPHANPQSWLQSHLLGPSLQNAPHQPSHLFLLFVDTHFLPPSSTHCLLFSYFSPLFVFTKILHLLHYSPHLRVGQEEKDASQESRQGREDPSRPPGQQPHERYRE